jgi:hypothetical protein
VHGCTRARRPLLPPCGAKKRLLLALPRPGGCLQAAARGWRRRAEWREATGAARQLQAALRGRRGRSAAAVQRGRLTAQRAQETRAWHAEEDQRRRAVRAIKK